MNIMRRQMLHPLNSKHNPYNFFGRIFLKMAIIFTFFVLITKVLDLIEAKAATMQDLDKVLACMSGEPMRDGDTVIRCSVIETEIKLIGDQSTKEKK